MVFLCSLELAILLLSPLSARITDILEWTEKYLGDLLGTPQTGYVAKDD